MKKLLYSVAAAAILFSACKKDKKDENAYTGSGMFTYEGVQYEVTGVEREIGEDDGRLTYYFYTGGNSIETYTGSVSITFDGSQAQVGSYIFSDNAGARSVILGTSIESRYAYSAMQTTELLVTVSGNTKTFQATGIKMEGLLGSSAGEVSLSVVAIKK